MPKLTLADISNLQNETTVTGTINSNNALISAALEKTLSRDGTSPNPMSASLDMNSNKILNLPLPLTDSEPARLIDIGNAPGYATAAAASAASASTSASTATTQASNASTSAATASTQATTATTQAGIATTQATAAAANATVVAGNFYNFSTTTTMADPTVGNLRFNNASPASTTALAFSVNTADSGNPSIRSWMSIWGSSTNANKAIIQIRKVGTPSTYAVFNITAAVTDNTTWEQITVAYVSGNGTFSNSDSLSVQFTRAGDKGTDGTVAISGTPVANQFATWNSATTVQGVAITGLVKGNGASAPAAAVANTDYLPVASPTFTGTLTGPITAGGSATNSTLTVEATSNNTTSSGDVLNLYGGTVTIGANRNLSKTVNIGSLGGGVILNLGTAGDGLAALNVYNGGGTPQVWVPGTGSTTLTFPSVTGTLVSNTASTAFSAQQYFTLATITDAVNLAWTVSTGQKAKVTLGGNRTMNAVTGAVEGATYSLWVFQDATGSRTITWTTAGAGGFDFGAAGAPTLTTTASKADLLTFEAVSIGGTLKLRYTGIAKAFT